LKKVWNCHNFGLIQARELILFILSVGFIFLLGLLMSKVTIPRSHDHHPSLN
jgi:hypothetical protein